MFRMDYIGWVREGTGEEVKIERNEILYNRGDRVTPELWEEIIQRGKKDVALYR